jgi:hypothetical protein
MSKRKSELRPGSDDPHNHEGRNYNPPRTLDHKSALGVRNDAPTNEKSQPDKN